MFLSCQFCSDDHLKRNLLSNEEGWGIPSPPANGNDNDDDDLEDDRIDGIAGDDQDDDLEDDHIDDIDGDDQDDDEDVPSDKLFFMHVLI